MKKIFITLLAMGLCSGVSNAQNNVTLTGSVQSDMMIAPQQDEKIGTSEYDNEYFLTNTYVDLQLLSKYIDAGTRFEYNQHPMPGYNDTYNDFKGWGVPNLWVKGKGKRAEVTLGSFYEQFGSGFILRSYEERSLGIDNSIVGAHLLVNPIDGVRVKALSGVQRTYWDWTSSVISGADVELSFDEWIKAWQANGTRLTLGASWVNKREDPNSDIVMADPTHKLKLPEFVNAFDVRARFQKGGFSMLAEYAQKGQDPNELNSYIYSKGHAEMLSLTYAKSGLSLLGQVKRSENMGFRSQRSMSPLSNAGYVNHLPAFTVDQTYSLAALYPYATQTEGEWAYQASAAYKVKGRFSPKFKVNYSLVTGLEHARENRSNSAMRGTDGAKSAFFKNGETYYQDLDFMYEQKMSKTFEHHAMYMYQQYNKGVIQSEGGNIFSHIFIYEPKWKINKKLTLRGEAQYLFTQHESGDWGFGLLELSVAPYFMFTISDQIGRCEPTAGEYGDVTHYFQAMVTGNYKSHRLQIGYGRTRAGYNCNGGVCRYIPASKGFTVSYNYNF